MEARRLRSWLAHDRADPGGLYRALQPAARATSRWLIRRSDVRQAVEQSGDSAAGPDGIPYLAWRRLGNLGVDVLFAVAQQLEQDSGTAAICEAFPLDEAGNTAFNAATQVFIPKKTPQQWEGGEFHRPQDTRPLSVVNTDNRLLANAARMRVEPMLAEAISQEQRGFLPGRSMLQNVVEVDGEMRHCCMDGTDPAAVFFDFAAAFPSLSHEYLHAVLEHLGIPASFRHLVKALYEGNGCTSAAAGGSFAGFSIRAGIRQGCPLSPLLFAVCGDLLVRRLRSACPESSVRAYADDLAVVTRKWRAMLTAARPVFDDFAAASGLFLNLGKTVFIPLGDDNVDTFRRDLGVVCPGWGGALVQMQAEYLGFTLGPEAGDKG